MNGFCTLAIDRHIWFCPVTLVRVTQMFCLGWIETQEEPKLQRWMRTMVPTMVAHHEPTPIMVLVLWKHKRTLTPRL